MSFLVGEADTISTLEELVTFIDAWDDGNSNGTGDVTTSESENDSSPYSNEDMESVLLDSLDGVLEEASFLPEKQLEAPKPMKRKRKKAPGASTQLQRRKKAEILALRAQSHQLERELERLQRNHAGPTTLPCLVSVPLENGENSLVPTSWSTIASTEYHERLKSEQLNQKLRAVLLEQMKMNTALRDDFPAQISLRNFESVFGRQPSPLAQLPSTEAGCAVDVIDGLEKTTEGLYLDSEVVFRHKETPSTDSVLCVKQEPTRGRVVEITMTTTLPCSVQEASAMFWRDLLAVRQYNDKSYHFHRQRKPASVEKSFVWLLQSDVGARELSGFTFVRKIEEPNRVVLVQADRLVLATGGIQFRMHRWTIITRSDDQARPSSVVRTMLQLHAEYTTGFTGKKDCLQEVEDLVMGVLSHRLRSYLHRQQGEFALEAEQIRMPTSGAATCCPV
ncbi:uncharacterized protein IUM83_17638 [Phytophthora cinnamomi]|uniref:uncharacterized protein n=1 Tax=Phytophthora cinnamomi TaxID=4785 RepID=UPI003559BEBF|nr:hypothetical protein IUM83_17638 [Phytophthora cinnamomi]